RIVEPLVIFLALITNFTSPGWVKINEVNRIIRDRLDPFTSVSVMKDSSCSLVTVTVIFLHFIVALLELFANLHPLHSGVKCRSLGDSWINLDCLFKTEVVRDTSRRQFQRVCCELL